MAASPAIQAQARLRLTEMKRLRRQARRTPAPAQLPAVSLRDFIADAWHVVEPATVFVPNWHIDAIAEHLEAITRGDLLDLIINMPPRFMKSTTVSVLWPVWEWTFRPATRWLTASYAMPLAIRDALKSRRLIQSDWFQQTYGTAFHLTGDQNQKSRYENDRTGYRIATSVNGGTTGEGGDVLVLDDPHNVQQAESDTQRASTLEWIDQTWSTRRNDPRRSRRVVVMQRLHEGDTTGHLLAQGGWEHLCLPQEYEPVVRVTGIGWSDPRIEDGALLWPERFGPAEVRQARATLGSYGYAGQHQQRPAPRGGGMFKRHWWRFYGTLPALRKVIQCVDSAFKTGVSNDYSVCATWGTDGHGSFYLVDLWRERVEYPDLIRALHSQHAKWKRLAPGLPLVIEDAASGQSAIQTLRRSTLLEDGTRMPALPVLPFPDKQHEDQKRFAGMDKAARAEGVTSLVEAGRAYLPNDAPWLEDFIGEHAHFPTGAHDDIVDTTSMALTLLNITKPVLAGGLVQAAVRGWQP